MKISGSYTIDAPREQVWEALNDMDVLARIVPGCERLEQVGDNEFEGTVKIGIQSIKGTYNGKIRLEDIQPPHHYKLVASGRSASGVVDGSGLVDLEEQDGKTLLKYNGDAQIGGTLASVGQRLIEGASRQLINQSLKALVEQIKQRAGGDGDTGAEGEPAAPAAAGSAPATSSASDNGMHTEAAVPATATAEAEQARPDTPATPAVTTESPAQSQSFARRTVVVPENEQLKPESVVRGMIEDIVGERPWLPWVVIAFVIGYLLGRSRG